MSIPAIVTAGDRKASRAIYGESKAYLVVAGRPLVAHVVATLQAVPEVSEVWVVGNAARLEPVLGDPALRSALRKPLHLVGQFRSLYENGWETYRRALPDAPPDGRDPTPDDGPALFLSTDLPFATPHEISEFIRRSLATGADYAVGLVTEESMRAFYPEAPGKGGIHMAYFNLREGRFRQSNLHLIRPGRVMNRNYVEEMYEHRHQREFCADRRARVAAPAQRARRLRHARLLRTDAPRGLARPSRGAPARRSRAALDPALPDRARHLDALARRLPVRGHRGRRLRGRHRQRARLRRRRGALRRMAQGTAGARRAALRPAAAGRLRGSEPGE